MISVIQETSPGRQKAFISFLKPSISKLVFLASWSVFILIELVSGRLDSPQMLWVAAYPLLFFYILAGMLSTIRGRWDSRGATFELMAFGVILFLVDQTLKAIVFGSLPYGSSQPLLDGSLQLSHARNLAGSWILQTLGLERPGLVLAMVMLLVVPGLLLSGLMHRYYSSLYRRSFWADMAFSLSFAGLASFLADMLLRGYILDYIGLPGLVTADLKDIYLSVGASSLIVEALENPRISWKWRGWRAEWDSLKLGVRNLYEFGRADLRRTR